MVALMTTTIYVLDGGDTCRKECGQCGQSSQDKQVSIAFIGRYRLDSAARTYQDDTVSSNEEHLALSLYHL